MNRFLILILLLVLIYALYRYQQYISYNDNVNENTKKQNKKKNNKQKKIKKENNQNLIKYEDDVLTDNISQMSINSLTDQSNENYKQDSILNSLDSGDTLSFLDEKASKESSFFFQ